MEFPPHTPRSGARTGPNSRARTVGGNTAASSPPSNRPLTLLAHGTLLAGAAAAVFLAAGPAQGSLGIFLVAAGLVMTVCPPRVKVDWWLWLAAGGIVAGGALAFLPERWFYVPAWRKTLEAIPSVPLPASVTPVPWETAFWLAVVALSALIGLFALAHPLRSAGLLGLSTAAVVISAAYTTLAIYAKRTGWHYPFSGDATFGFFPNRNHTATFLVVGSVLSMGVLRFALREGRWRIALVAGGGLTLDVVALCFFSGSRGGIVFLLIGAVIWLAGLGRAHLNTPLLVSFVALLVACGLLFLVSGSEVRHRLFPTAEDQPKSAAVPAPAFSAAPSALPPDPSPELRLAIYQDTGHLVRDYPLTGTGLGTFVMVFPQYRQGSLNSATALHPESDWLMLAAEAGIPALVFAAGLGWLLLRHCQRWRQYPSWPLHWGCAAAVAAACLHGIFDVPAHRAAPGWWVLVLAGAGLHGGWNETTGRSRLQHALFVLGGLAALALGTQLIRAQWFGVPPLPPFAKQGTEAAVIRLFEAEKIDAATRLVRQYIRASPLYDPYYRQLGLLLARPPHAGILVQEAFEAQRLISPNDPAIPFQQGLDWIYYDGTITAELWRDALARREKIDRAEARGDNRAIILYREMMGRATQPDFFDVQQSLLELIWPRADYVRAWMGTATEDVLKPNLPRIARDPNFLAQLGDAERKQFLMTLYANGASAELETLMNTPGWQSAAWQITVRRLVDRQQFESLVDLACQHAGVTLTLPDRKEGYTAPADVTTQETNDPAAAFTAYWQEGNTVAARRVLNEATGNAADTAVAPEAWRLKAALSARDKDWSSAWRCLKIYFQRSGKDS